jgi:hypothetical protein
MADSATNAIVASDVLAGAVENVHPDAGSAVHHHAMLRSRRHSGRRPHVSRTPHTLIFMGMMI